MGASWRETAASDGRGVAAEQHHLGGGDGPRAAGGRGLPAGRNGGGGGVGMGVGEGNTSTREKRARLALPVVPLGEPIPTPGHTLPCPPFLLPSSNTNGRSLEATSHCHAAEQLPSGARQSLTHHLLSSISHALATATTGLQPPRAAAAAAAAAALLRSAYCVPLLQGRLKSGLGYGFRVY